MTEISQCSQARRYQAVELKKHIKAEITKGTHKIAQLLKNVEEMQRANKLLKVCHQYAQQQDQQVSIKLIWQYNSKYDYEFTRYTGIPTPLNSSSQLVAVNQQCKNNWIQDYLDREDVAIYGRIGPETVRITEERNGVIKFTKVRGAQLENNQENIEVLETKLKHFYGFNKKVKILFTAHKLKYQFSNRIVRTKITGSPQSQKSMVILQLTHNEAQVEAIRRVLILKQEESEQGRSYRIYEGYYELADIVQPLNLPAGQYMFVPFPNTLLNIYTRAQQQFSIVESHHREEIKELNLLLHAFDACHLSKMSGQFMRTCDLGLGVVIQMYRNPYKNRIWFRNAQKESRQEDKKLMFQSLYSRRYQSYRLRPGETIVEFYQITRKPAVLFQPHKKVIVDDDEDSEAQTVHAILK